MILKLTIVTPYGIAWNGEADYISFRTVEGSVGFLPGRAPAVMKLAVDVIEIKSQGDVHIFAVHGGYVLQERDKTTVVTDAAERPEEINVQRARQRLKRAEELLGVSQSRRERARNQGKLQRHMLRIKVGSRN